jgi:predicted glycoside hydrolase/deacetylase ChbG (UPF0249 family)
VRKQIRIIVNSDDLGAYPNVDAETFALMDAGKVTSATLMANGGTIESAIQEAKRRKGCSFGVHLNLTSFRPLTSSPGMELLLMENGEFSSDLARLARLLRLGRVRDAVYKELKSQIALIVDSGLPVSHLDSHQHVHTMPYFFPVLKKLQMEFHVLKVRLTVNEFFVKRPIVKDVLKSGWNFALRNFCRTETTQGCSVFADFVRLARGGKLRYSLYELITHPGPLSFREETELLWSDWESSVAYDIQRITYNDI